MVMYKYNDYILPELPSERDGLSYPYVVIVQSVDPFVFFLLCVDSPFYVETYEGADVVSFSEEGNLILFAYTRSDSNGWVAKEPSVPSAENFNYIQPENTVIWTNTNIYDESGNLEYEATVAYWPYTTEEVTLEPSEVTVAPGKETTIEFKLKHTNGDVIGVPDGRWGVRVYDKDGKDITLTVTDVIPEAGESLALTIAEDATGYSKIEVSVRMYDGEEYAYVTFKHFDLRSWLIGYTLGICGKPLPLTAKKEPVAYLYNGVRLPKLPEWDREAYPYAFLYKYNSYTYLNCTTHRPFFSDGKFCMVNPSISFVLENDAFTDKRENGLDNLVFGLTEDKLQLIWTNFDVLNDDGSVYMAAGYTNYPDAPPVPAETTDPCPDKSVMHLFDNASTDVVGDTVTLPAIPEVDLRVYPYMGVRYSSSRYVLILSRHPIWYGRELANYSYCYRQESDSPNEWTSLGAHRYGYPTIWANYDVYDVDGNRVISASEPIPVYDKE